MSYYRREDLSGFASIGDMGQTLAESFFAYYEGATGEGGVLSRREKALIALALAHSKRCPYCIDAFTTTCLESGSNPEEMMEAVHVAAAMDAGMTLVHAVQMRNALARNGVE